MKIMKIIFMIAITMAVAISLSMTNIAEEEKDSLPLHRTDDSSTSSRVLEMPSKRASRFLAVQTNPRAADHCKKDNEVCDTSHGTNSTCCNNKCVYLQTDKDNCGTCKNKCKYTQSCCRGQCVYLSMDKRHCGKCNNRCKKGDDCIFGMCDYGS
ncbi:hypothetical protein PVL29_025706 [Vitis rotundifolia]|uniref:Stigma-specific STIG1-like protein 1 n=1 Tax=Vitis rotundifolia TaxID=103349 RepID=A0AA39D5T2_VITRO|nr:hypothetical protein PVL29_025706 [Vitis rotundifolia]